MNLKRLAAVVLAAAMVMSVLAGCGHVEENPIENPGVTLDPQMTEPIPTGTEPLETLPSITTPLPVTTEPTTAATTEQTTAPTTAATTEATTKKTTKDDYTVEEMSGTMYATMSLNVRKGPSTDFSKMGALKEGEAVTVTGRASTGWYQISYNGETGYVSNLYMSNTPGSAKPASTSSDDDELSEEYVDEPGSSNNNTTPSTPSTNVTPTASGDWVKKNGAQYMYDHLTEDRFKNAFDKLASAIEVMAPRVSLDEYLSHSEAMDLAENMAQMVSIYYCYFDCVSGVTENGATLTLKYYCNTIEEANKMMAELESVGDKILNRISGYSDYNKVKYVYEYICKNSSYDHGPHYASAYGALVDGMATCLGYERATFYLLSRAGFDCVHEAGIGVSDGHAWVKVKVDGKWVNVDTGWGDPLSPEEKDSGYVCYDYLCVSDDYMARTRTKVYDLSKYYTSPAATTDSLSWYVRNGCYAETEKEAVDILKKATKEAVKDTDSEFVYVRIQLASQELFDTIAEEYDISTFTKEIISEYTSKRKAGGRYSNSDVRKTWTLTYRLRKA